MENQDFKAVVSVAETPRKAFEAINDVRGWWSVNIQGTTDKRNGEFTHRDKYLNVTFKVSHLTPEKIVWDVTKSHCNMFMDNLHEWEGTRIVFDITEKNGRTEVGFTHQGLVPQFECYQVCSRAWTYFITTSLKNFIETSKGDPIGINYASFTTTITLDKSPREVYDAVTDVRGWWLHNIIGDTYKVGDEFLFYAGERRQFHFKIIEMVPCERIVWLVLDQRFKDTEEREWKGTTLLFEISETEGQTQLRFTHQGLVPPLDCYETCQGAWSKYIQLSLANFIKTGEGMPNKW